MIYSQASSPGLRHHTPPCPLQDPHKARTLAWSPLSHKAGTRHDHPLHSKEDRPAPHQTLHMVHTHLGYRKVPHKGYTPPFRHQYHKGSSLTQCQKDHKPPQDYLEYQVEQVYQVVVW